jgi:hypothetical protein
VSSEFDPWPHQEPPSSFADRVIAAELQRRARPRWRRPVALAAPLLVAAAAALVLWPRREEQGDVLAQDRSEVKLTHGVAVLEPGARIRWRGLRVEQPQGEVFYRIDKGAPYRVETPAGQVEVEGTCFRVRIHGTEARAPREPGDRSEDTMTNIGKIGAGLAAGVLLTVGVYEGKVRVSSAGQRQELTAGGTTTVGGGSARGAQQAQEHGAVAPASGSASGGPSDDFVEANRNLVDTIQQLNKRIAAAEEQKKKLNKELQEAQVALERAGTSKGQQPSRHEFDLDQDDWKRLAENGTIKFRVPCFRKGGWKPSPESLGALGLAPDDAPALTEAYQQSNQRLWSVIRPLCIEALGHEAAVDKIGPDTCIHLVSDMTREKDRNGWAEAMRQVGEVRAGLRPEPSEDTARNPVFKVFSALTGEAKNFEADLAKHLGPEDARRVTFSEELCAGRSTFGGPGPRPK